MKKVLPKVKKRKQKTRKSFWDVFKSKNLQLVLVMLLALAIPLTILGVQNIQNLQQDAASTPKAGKDCTKQAGSPIVANADDAAVEFGETISFTKEGGFSQEDFDTGVNFGNGIDSNKCTFTGGEIKDCPTKKGKTAKPIKTSTGKQLQGAAHTVTDHGTPICEYYVFIPAKPTKDPKRPSPTPKIKEGTPGYQSPTPRKPTPTRMAGGNCTGSLNEASCTADNKPRMRVSYDMRGGAGPCQAVIELGNNKWIVTSKCTNADGQYLTQLTDKNGTKSDFKPGTKYKLTITNGSSSCNKVSEATTLSCGKNAGTPSPSSSQKNIQCNEYLADPTVLQQGQLCVDSNKKVISCPACPK